MLKKITVIGSINIDIAVTKESFCNEKETGSSGFGYDCFLYRKVIKKQ